MKYRYTLDEKFLQKIESYPGFDDYTFEYNLADEGDEDKYDNDYVDLSVEIFLDIFLKNYHKVKWDKFNFDETSAIYFTRIVDYIKKAGSDPHILTYGGDICLHNNGDIFISLLNCINWYFEDEYHEWDRIEDHFLESKLRISTIYILNEMLTIKNCYPDE